MQEENIIMKGGDWKLCRKNLFNMQVIKNLKEEIDEKKIN